jgi:uncharacterized repeat protein (TIGR01451 family)
MIHLINKTFKICATLLIPLGGLTFLHAQDNPLEATIEAYIVTNAPDGSEQLAPAEVANPGDVIVYRARFENQGEAALDSVRPIVPIPVGLEYVADSVNPAPQEASIDGATFQPFPVLDAAGQPVDPASYRSFRWELEKLEFGAPFTAELRARLTQ